MRWICVDEEYSIFELVNNQNMLNISVPAPIPKKFTAQYIYDIYEYNTQSLNDNYSSATDIATFEDLEITTDIKFKKRGQLNPNIIFQGLYFDLNVEFLESIYFKSFTFDNCIFKKERFIFGWYI